MITYRNKNSWQRPLVIALVGSVAVGVGVWAWMGHSASDTATQEDASSTVAAATALMAVATANGQNPSSASMAASAPTLMSDGRPSDIAPAVWAALNKATAAKPHLKPEVEKVVSYMRFQHSFEYWQTLEGTRDEQQRRQLGQSMLDEMPERLKNGEFTMGESLMMITALLSDLEPDEKKRELLIEDWSKKLAFAAPQPTDDAQIQELQKRTEDKRIVPGLLTEGPNPDQAKLEQALEERMRASH
jgi:hypothetical protein